jgi:hypothetical protein
MLVSKICRSRLPDKVYNTSGKSEDLSSSMMKIIEMAGNPSRWRANEHQHFFDGAV